MADSISVKDMKDKVEGKEMDLSLMQITKIPVKEIFSFKKVNSVDLSCNQIVELPENFCSILTNLVKLDLSKNRIKELPKDIFRLTLLQHLDLYNNQIVELPITFSQMKSLKWLDLKDNPLEPVLAKVVGGCLDEKECRKCASAVVTHYKNVSSDMERIRQQELKKEREKKALIRKVEEEKEREEENERKRQKKLEKEERRKNWEKQQREKDLESKKRKREEDDDDSDRDVSLGSSRKSASDQSSWIFSFWGILIMSFIAVIISAVGVRLYCQENPTNDECIVVKDWTENYKQATTDHLKAVLDNAKDIAQFGLAKVSDLRSRFGF